MLQVLETTKAQSSWSQKAEILACQTDDDGVYWHLGLMDTLADPNFVNAVEQLTSESITSNPFFEVSFLKASTENLCDEKIQFLFLSKQSGEHEELKLFTPVTLSSVGFWRYKVLKNWTTHYTPLGTPLISDNKNQETLKAFSECLQKTKHNTATAVVFDQIAKDNNFINGLYDSHQLADRLLLSVGIPRAGLKPVKNLDYIATHFSGKRKQRLRAARRELDKFGKVTFHNTDDSKEFKQSFNDFLLLEETSWKGLQKTALKSTPATEKFAKNAAFNAIQNKKCQIHELKLNGKTIASLIAFESKGYIYPWKIAFDESYSKYSIGNLLTTHATAEFAKSKSFKGLDSLAAEHNETTLRFWPDEKEFHTMTIGIGRNPTQSALAVTNAINRSRSFRKRIRTLVNKHNYLERLVSSLRM